MTEVEALAAVEAAESKVQDLKTKRASLLQNIKDKQKQIVALEQQVNSDRQRCEDIERTCWGRHGTYVVGDLPRAINALECATKALNHARSPKIQGVTTLAEFGYSHSTGKNHILLHSGGEFTVHRVTGRIRGNVSIWRDLDQSELAALDAFVASLEGK